MPSLQLILDKKEKRKKKEKKKMIGCSARLICKAPKSAHITLLLYDLHWLPISSRIQYKISFICLHTVSGTASLSCFVSILSFPLFSLSLGYSDLPCSWDRQKDPVIWDTLPLPVRHSSLLSSFKSKLKTHLSSSAYCSVVFFRLILQTRHQLCLHS